MRGTVFRFGQLMIGSFCAGGRRASALSGDDPLERLVTAHDLSLNDVARLRESLVASGHDPVRTLFEASGVEAPTIVWRPAAASIHNAVLSRFHRCAQAHADGRGRVREALLASEEFAALREHAMVLEPVAGGRDFRYVHYGEAIASAYERDLTGACTSDIAGTVGVFFIALYQAVLQRDEPVMSIHEPPRQVFVRKWHRLIVPLHDASGDVRRIAAVNVADNDLRAGLDALPDPVMLVDATSEVVFANRAACRMFGPGGTRRPRGRLEDVLGTDVDLAASPESLVRQGVLHERRTALVRDAILTPVRVTVGATFYRQTPFYVITVQPSA